MKTIIQRPAAAAIIGSLRAIGYSFDTALADVVDNSISANATSIEIRLETNDERPVLSVYDNGIGMERNELLEAMRHGGLGINRIRAKTDLGRYGLGLKTASLSQCRRLTVASIAKSGSLSIARWDLDEVERSNDWVLLLPAMSDVDSFMSIRQLIKRNRGTVVIWEYFDSLSGATNEFLALQQLLDDSRSHLALIFQRFLKGGDSDEEVEILINGLQTIAIDPFLSLNPKTQQLPTEEVKVGQSTVRITAFILPQLKNMATNELESLGGPAGIRNGQGFYVYRNRRLIIAATWFRMLRFDELTKLARVRIDIPNTIDHLWGLDVKKSVAYPPEPIRRVLKRIIERIAGRSLDVFREPRNRRLSIPVTTVWTRRAHANSATYSLNREHPMILELLDGESREQTRNFERLLRLIEISVPTGLIFADMNGGISTAPNDKDVENTLRTLLAEWLAKCGTDSNLKYSIINALPTLEPFAQHSELTRALAEEFTNGT